MENSANKKIERYKKKYYRDNIDKVKSRAVLYKKNNPEKNKKYQKKYYEKNKEKINAYGKRWALENRDKKSAYERNWAKKYPEKAIGQRLFYNHGITLEQYNQMFVNQNGICLICKKYDKAGKRLVVDHNHESGTIRGLLCDSCNKGLGNFKENLESLAEAIKYLKRI